MDGALGMTPPPEPDPKYRTCNICGRPALGKNDKMLIEGYYDGPFAFWYYECRWHRAANTRRKRRWQIRERTWVTPSMMTEKQVEEVAHFYDGFRRHP